MLASLNMIQKEITSWLHVSMLFLKEDEKVSRQCLSHKAPRKQYGPSLASAFTRKGVNRSNGKQSNITCF